MKIAFIYDCIYPYVKGGAEKRFWEMAKRLAEKGHQVCIFGMKWWEGRNSFIKEGVYFYGICKAMKLYSQNGKRKLIPPLYFSLRLLPFLAFKDFDIIDCNAFPYLSFFPVKFFSFLKRISLVITWQEVWENYWYKYLGYFKGFIAKFIEKIVIKLSDNIIVHSLKIKSKLIKYGKNKNIRVIPHGVDLKFIKNIQSSQEKTDLIFVGRLIKDKNVDILIKSIFLVKKEFKNIKCLIIGEGPEKNNLIRLVEKLDLKDNVIFKDFLEYEELISYMKASKIFVFPSTREGFGIVVLEAMACGLSVITVEHPMNAATELVKEGENGFICRLDEREISQRILILLRDENLRVNIAKTAFDYVRNYDWDRITEQNEKVYNSIISK